MVTDNPKTAITTVVMLAAVLLLGYVPFSHTIPSVFADKHGVFTGFASHEQGLFTAHGWYEDQGQHYNKKWHHHSDRGESVVNVQNADCSSTSTANGGNANGGNGGAGNGGNGGSSNGGPGGSSSDSGTGGNGSPGGFSNGGNGGNLPGGSAGSGGSSDAGSQTSCSNTSTFHISNGA